jgi:hypothetical protein
VRQVENLYFLPKISPVEQTILPDPLPLQYAGEEGRGHRKSSCVESFASTKRRAREGSRWVQPVSGINALGLPLFVTLPKGI